MRIFARYVFRQTTGALLLILLSLTGIVWIALALRQLNLVTSQGQDAVMLLKMTTLAVPNLIALIAPIALLVAAIYVVNRLNSDSELIVMTASGATIWTLGRPLLLLAAIVSAGVAVSNHFVMPWSLKQLRLAIVQVRTDLIGQVIQPGKFTSPEGYLTFHIRDRAPNGDLLGLLVYDQRDAANHSAYLAERGVIVKQKPFAFLVMQNGHIIRRKPTASEPPQIIAFETYAVDIERFETKSSLGGFRPRERYYGELVKPDPNDPEFIASPGQFRAELHERFASLIYPFAFVLLVLGFVGQARSTRQNRVEAILIAVAVAAGIRVGGLAVNNLVVLRASAVPLLYAVPIGASLLSLVLIWWNGKPRSGPTVRDRIAAALTDVGARLPSLPAVLRRRNRKALPQMGVSR